jgi:hypothetical protein
VRRLGPACIATLIALACAAPAQAATEVHWEVGYGNGRYVLLEVDTVPGEANDIEVFAEPRVVGQPESVIVRDHSAGLATIPPVPGDYCVSKPSCTVPCDILSATEARCSLKQGFRYEEPVDERLIRENYLPYGNPLNPGGTATYTPNPEEFTHVFVPLRDGADRFRNPAHAGVVPPRVTATDGGDRYELGSYADFLARDGDRVELKSETPVLSGVSVTVQGDAEVLADNDRSDTIRCWAGVDNSNIHVDQYDDVDCGSLSQEPALPVKPPVNPG